MRESLGERFGDFISSFGFIDSVVAVTFLVTFGLWVWATTRPIVRNKGTKKEKVEENGNGPVQLLAPIMAFAASLAMWGMLTGIWNASVWAGKKWFGEIVPARSETVTIPPDIVWQRPAITYGDDDVIYFWDAQHEKMASCIWKKGALDCVYRKEQ